MMTEKNVKLSDQKFTQAEVDAIKRKLRAPGNLKLTDIEKTKLSTAMKTPDGQKTLKTSFDPIQLNKLKSSVKEINDGNGFMMTEKTVKLSDQKFTQAEVETLKRKLRTPGDLKLTDSEKTKFKAAMKSHDGQRELRTHFNRVQLDKLKAVMK